MLKIMFTANVVKIAYFTLVWSCWNMKLAILTTSAVNIMLSIKLIKNGTCMAKIVIRIFNINKFFQIYY